MAKIEQKQLDQLTEAWSRMINCISHDLTTPLAILRMSGQNCEKTLASLRAGYQLAIKNNLPVESKIDERYLEAVENLVPIIKQNVTDLTSFLSVLYPYNRQLLSTAEESQPLSIKICVEEALKKYTFVNDQERALVHITDLKDFKFSLAPIFIDYLLSNLLSNAFKAIQRANKGEISIWTEDEPEYNTLHFKDTGLGMEADALERVFSHFFSKKNDKIVPGLGFCRLAVLQRGGNILCAAVKGEYTEFTIKFPK